MLTDDDIRYIDREFVRLDELCRRAGRDVGEVRRLIAARELAAPPYPGLEYVPADYLELPDARGFAAEYAGVDPHDDLAAYLDGIYFVCLRRAVPTNIVRKEQLVGEVRALLAAPLPADEAWRRGLRTATAELDVLERPFSPDYDRLRFGKPPTRDELIDAPRRTWPGVFAAEVVTSG